MFEPKYTLTPKTLSNIALSERLYGRLEALRVPQRLELNLERDHLIKASYISNSIEGNPLSLPEVTNLILGDRIPANRDEKEVKNYFEILKNLSVYKERGLEENLVLELHKKLLTGVNDKISGRIRNTPTVVGRYVEGGGKTEIIVKHNPPFHAKEDIELNLDELLSWAEVNSLLPVIVRAGVFHHQFVYLHPFEDGNGRTCRLLTTLIFLKSGFAIDKYFILDDYYDVDRNEYSDKLHSGDSGDKTKWLEYFSDGVKYSFQSALGKLERATEELPMEERLTGKEKGVLKILKERKEITSETLSELLKVTRQQAHALLKSLVEKGFAQRKGTTKGSYYFLK